MENQPTDENEEARALLPKTPKFLKKLARKTGSTSQSAHSHSHSKSHSKSKSKSRSPSKSPSGSTESIDSEEKRRLDELPEEFLNFQRKEYTRIISINVGGEIFECYWHILDRHKGTRLSQLRGVKTHSQLQEICDDYSLPEREFFFDRNPETFKTIMNYYRFGSLHLVEGICMIEMMEELSYWGIDEIKLGDCCSDKYNQRKENVFEEIKTENQTVEMAEIEEFGDGCCAKIQKGVWDLMEESNSSRLAKIIAIISILFVLISTVSLCLNTMPGFLQINCSKIPKTLSMNCSEIKKDMIPDLNITAKEKEHLIMENSRLAIVEDICIAWFSIEYLLRLAASPNKVTFLKGGLNNIDILAIMPYYISWAFKYYEQTRPPPDAGAIITESDNEVFQFDDIRRVIQVFRIMRIMRVFKLARHSTGLQSLGFTLINSYKELILLVMFLSLGVLLFASVLYFAESEEEDTEFYSIPRTFWWGIITMTTVGYGDMVPTSGVGKAIGISCCLCGILVVAFPIPIITGNFEKFYKDTARKDKALSRRAELELAKAEGRYFTIKLGSHDKSLTATPSKTPSKVSRSMKSQSHSHEKVSSEKK